MNNIYNNIYNSKTHIYHQLRESNYVYFQFIIKRFYKCYDHYLIV
jgi:hypothetical protein